MRIVCYEPDYNEKHRTILRAFALGAGAEVRDLKDYVDCDVAVVFGLVKTAFAPTHAKQAIFDRHKDRRLILLETAIVELKEAYYSAGFGGIARAADYRNAGSPPDRWESFGVPVAPWVDRVGGPVYVCGQLPRDTTVQFTDHVGWCRSAVRFYSDLGVDVRFRPHPRVVDADIYGIARRHLDDRPLRDALAEARAIVTWNSGVAVDAVLAGVPAVAVDSWSMAWDMASHDLEGALDPIFPGRSQWLANLGYVQWSLDEFRSGAAWRHLMRDG